MKEEFIAFLWNNCLLYPENLITIDGDKVNILHPGHINTNSGPDFFAAKIRIKDTIWVGNVEIHVFSSDWIKHGHHLDGAYDNIILHLVYSNDKTVCNSKGLTMPTLEIKDRFDPRLYKNYSALKLSANWIACQHSICQVDDLIIGNWLNRLLIERLERKTREVLQFYHYFSHDWENTCYYLLARNFGFKVNASPFSLLAQKTPRTILMKNRDKLEVLEAILFGQAGMLEATFSDPYPTKLKNEYKYQRIKHKLEPISKDLWRFARMRPVNFPTLRIAQFAMVLHQTGNLFRKIIEAESIEELNALFGVAASPYWNYHYRFDQPSTHVEKNIGTAALNNMIINTVVPILFIYGKETINNQLSDKAIQFLHALAPEDNLVIRKWKALGLAPHNAADTQALLELRKYFCISKRCLHCSIGYQIIYQ